MVYDQDRPEAWSASTSSSQGSVNGSPDGQRSSRGPSTRCRTVIVRVARCFPWSFDGRYISIRNKDNEELYLFRTLDQAESKTRKLIEHELAMQEFVPRITAVENIHDRYELMAWKVRTDRGPIELQIKTTDDIQLLDDGRIVIKDYAGSKFEVRDIESLDSRNRQLIEDHLG